MKQDKDFDWVVSIINDAKNRKEYKEWLEENNLNELDYPYMNYWIPFCKLNQQTISVSIHAPERNIILEDEELK